MSRVLMHERIRKYIDANGLSRKIIAMNMQITESKLSLILNGKRRMTVDDYEAICMAMAVDPMRFFTIDQELTTNRPA